jgi:glutathione synthase/RimK-type ligase-like ATP-grasp enzyme
MQRFSNENTSAELHETGTVLTTAEVERLLRFCAFIGLDYGELDVLRDKVDGRIYVVDVNSTPDGPPNHLSGPQSEIALARLGAAFEDAFLSRAT